MSRPAVATAVLFGVFITAGRMPADDVSSLRRDLAALRAEVEALKKEVAALKAGPSRASLAARFDAAAGLSDVSEKQRVYAVLGVDAARSGDAKLTKKALDGISDVSTKQSITYRAALLLAKAGQGEDAVALAKTLSDVTQKQKALAKIARGELDE
jgi:hypothetical protein